jgi:hypothetical protein
MSVPPAAAVLVRLVYPAAPVQRWVDSMLDFAVASSAAEVAVMVMESEGDTYPDNHQVVQTVPVARVYHSPAVAVETTAAVFGNYQLETLNPCCSPFLVRWWARNVRSPRCRVFRISTSTVRLTMG